MSGLVVETNLWEGEYLGRFVGEKVKGFEDGEQAPEYSRFPFQLRVTFHVAIVVGTSLPKVTRSTTSPTFWFTRKRQGRYQGFGSMI